MTSGSAEKAMDQLLAAINQGKDPPRRYQPGVTLGFPDLDVFTPEALERIRTLGGGDPARTARLSVHVLEIAQRECAVPVLPDLVDDAAAQIDLERADLKADGARPQPDHEHSAPRAGIGLQGVPPDPSARRRHDPAPPGGGTAPGVSAPRRRMRRAAAVLGVLLLLASGVAGYLAYSGRLDTLGLGDPREILTSGLAAIGVVPPEVPPEQQERGSGDSGASSPAERAAESEPPAGSSGEAAVPEDDRRDETPDEAGAAGHPVREDDRRAGEAVLAERGPEMEAAAENAIRQRFDAVREQAEQARRALAAVGSEMEQLHRRQHEEMQVRHARELDLAGADGADAVAQAKDRHQQEQAALQEGQNAERDRLAASHDELDRQLQDARRDAAEALKVAVANGEGGEGNGGDSSAVGRPGSQAQPRASVTSEPVAPASPADLAPADPVAAESGLQPQSGQPQSDKADDRRQQAAAAGEKLGDAAGEISGELPGMVAPGQTEPLQVSQDEAPVAAPMTPAPQQAERPENAEAAAPRAGQPLPPALPSSPPAGPAPGAAEGAGTAETAAPIAAEALAAGQDVADLVNRGNALLDLGDLASARLFYRLAADRGSPEGAMLMGMTFDPVYFARTGIRGTRPQIQDALHWYDKAITMGSRPAERRMGELRSWLERSAAAGDAQAKAALQQLR